MLEWIQQNWELLAMGGAGGGGLVGIIQAVRGMIADNNDDQSEFRGQLMERLDTVENRCDVMQRQQMRMSTRIIELSQERDALRKQLAQVEKRASTAEKRAAESEKRVEELRSKIDAKNREIHQLQARLGRLEERSDPTL